MKALIIDDEIAAISSLKIMLENYCPEVTEIISASTVEKGLELVSYESPDILFLDINMPRMTGIDFAECIDRSKIDIVIVSAHSDYAIKAIKLSVTDYLLKPVSIIDLIKVTNSIAAHRKSKATAIYESKDNSTFVYNGKIAFQLKEGIQYIDIKEIIMIEAIGSYSKLHFTNKTTLLISKNLKQVESVLEKHFFFRAHRSHIINLNCITKYKPVKDGGTIYLTNGIEIELSRTQKSEFNTIMDNLNIGKI